MDRVKSLNEQASEYNRITLDDFVILQIVVRNELCYRNEEVVV